MNNYDRIMLCHLVSLGLSRPDAGFFLRMRQAMASLRVDLWDDGGFPLRELAEELRTLAQVPSDTIQGEYERLFVVANSHAPCPLYESACTIGETGGGTAERVAAEYGRWGIVSASREADHAGAELEFVAYLLSQETDEAITAAKSFWTEHVVNWQPRLASCLVKESNLGFYRGLGLLMADILQHPRMHPTNAPTDDAACLTDPKT